eukprot:10467075-Ditylum_brightwellii.AAC.1
MEKREIPLKRTEGEGGMRIILGCSWHSAIRCISDETTVEEHPVVVVDSHVVAIIYGDDDVMDKHFVVVDVDDDVVAMELRWLEP